MLEIRFFDWMIVYIPTLYMYYFMSVSDMIENGHYMFMLLC